MLLELRIENFAIIDQLDMHFGPGLTILTGETGAGKSIIVDAVEAILGGRADAAMVRSGAEYAFIEAVFDLNNESLNNIQSYLESEGLLDNADQFSLGREIRVAGRNIARINGRSVSLAQLREIGEQLIDVHGQSEHLSLLKVRQHIQLLDRYSYTQSHLSVEEHQGRYRDLYRKWKDIEAQIEKIQKSERDAARRADMLNYQINEIQSAQLTIGEEENLTEERNRLANSEAISKLVQECLYLLDEGSPEASAATDLIGQVVRSLGGLTNLDPTQKSQYERSQFLFEELNDLANNLRSYLETIEFNPKRLNWLEERISLIDNLKRKYGDTIQDVLKFLENAALELDTITHSEERLEELLEERRTLLNQLGVEGEAMSSRRKLAGASLAEAMETELNELNMAGARFQVSFKMQEDEHGVQLSDGRKVAFGPHGLEQVEFLIAPNPGEGYKPLAKIASGGETSRLMLALKNVLTKADWIPTLIFDEIDQGIGGRIGVVVGEKLWNLGIDHQVFCITHLPQLAAFGNQHLAVEKHVSDGRTTTRIWSLDGESRIQELAEMMGEVSEGTLHSARELAELVRKKQAGA